MRLIFLLFTFLNLSPVFAKDTHKFAPDIQRIIDRGTLVVALHKDNVPPFSMLKQGLLTGIDVEIAQDIATKLGVSLKFNRQPKTYDEVVNFVAQGKADIAVSLISSSLDRAKYVFFSKPYLILKQALLINRLGLASLQHESNNKDIRSLLNNPTVKIGTMVSTSYIGFAHQDYPKATIVNYDSWDNIITDVKAGILLAAFYDEIAINNWNKQHPEDSLYLKTQILTHRHDPLAIAINSKDTFLLEWINLYISQENLDGNFQALKLKYF